MKPAWFGHVKRQDSLSKTILWGILEGGQQCSQQRKCWMEYNQKKNHASAAHDSLMQKRLEENLCQSVPHMTQSVKGLNWTSVKLFLHIPAQNRSLSDACRHTRFLCTDIVQPNVPYHLGRYLPSLTQWAEAWRKMHAFVTRCQV